MKVAFRQARRDEKNVIDLSNDDMPLVLGIAKNFWTNLSTYVSCVSKAVLFADLSAVQSFIADGGFSCCVDDAIR